MRWWPVAVLVLAGCTGPADDRGTSTGDAPDGATADDGVQLALVADDFDRPLQVIFEGAMFVVEQGGIVWRVDDGREQVLDISDQISGGSEQGLLGLAFDPHDATRAFVSYTDTTGASILSRFTYDGALGSEVVLMETTQPAGNHNGGHIEFGPDGYLYYGLGDGGGRDDLYQNGQNKGTVLGTILRLDVSGTMAAPAPGNPFEDDRLGDDRIWAWGLRNPWRFHFDDDGRLWIGDVGQDAWEEVDLEEPGSGGINYGWPAYEGSHMYRGLALDHVLPIAEYANQGADCSVTGGHVATDPLVPALLGKYVFADFCSGIIRTLEPDGVGWRMETLMNTQYAIASFGKDAEGHLYLVNLNGAVYRFV